METKFQVGQLVSYEDRANPRTMFIVVAVNDNPWSTYELRNLDATCDSPTIFTDGRQSGWEAVR